jgi:hypothetical protein
MTRQELVDRIWCCDCDGRCTCFCHTSSETVAQHHRELWAADVALRAEVS